MVSMKATYLGEKHCDLVHGPSGKHIETDAPKDNNGRGAAFSPTDLIGAALASCILTTIAIVAERDGVDIKGSTCDVSKEMITTPTRRIAKLPAIVHLPAKLTPDQRRKFEKVAVGCPVHHSIHPDIESPLTFVYDM